MSTTEAKQDVERIRQIREGSEESSDGPEILVCPINGCSRTIINAPRDLQSHVREAGGDHEGLGLNENLEIIELAEEEGDGTDESSENTDQIDPNEESNDLPSEEQESPEQAEIDPEEIDEEEYHMLWHSGTQDDDPRDQEPSSNGLWGPGAPKGEVK